MLQFLPYALAAYGGYKGYKASKEAGGSGLQRLLGAGTGAALGYYGGKMIPGVTASGSGFTPFTQLGQKFPFLSALPGQVPGQMTGAAAAANTGSFFVPSAASQVPATSAGAATTGRGIFDIFKSQNAQGQMAYDPLKIGTAAGLVNLFWRSF
jgi:hypothetical protein